MQVRDRLLGLVAKNWSRTQKVLPNRYLPLPMQAGWVYVNPHNSPTVLQRILRRYEPDKFANVARFLPTGGGFVDVGANAGDFTLWAATCGGPDTRVLAVEVEAENAKWLRRTIARRHLTDRVSVAEVAAADRDGEVELLLSAQNITHSIVETELHHKLERFKPVGRVTVPTRRLDDLIADAGLPRVDLIKIDVEGAEMLVLAGATSTLAASTPLVMLIDVHFGVDLDALLALLHGYGFVVATETDPDQPISAVPRGCLSIVAQRG